MFVRADGKNELAGAKVKTISPVWFHYQMSPGTSAKMDTEMDETFGRGLGFGLG